jgi:hypothetical protein
MLRIVRFRAALPYTPIFYRLVALRMLAKNLEYPRRMPNLRGMRIAL